MTNKVRKLHTRSPVYVELCSPTIPHRQSGIWTNAKTDILERDGCPPSHLLQVTGIVEAPASGKRNGHHSRLELDKLAQDRNDIQISQFRPYITEFLTSHKLHKDVLGLRRIVRHRRVSIYLGDRQPRGTEELHCGSFTGHGVILGGRSWVRNTSDHLEVVAKGDEEGTVEAALGELR